MCNSTNNECDRKKVYGYFISIPGGDSLLCKPYRREQFYQIGCSSSSCSGLYTIQTKESRNELSAALLEETHSCTCLTPISLVCPSLSRTECNTCCCTCDQPRRPVFYTDICRLTEMVDMSSSISDLLTELKDYKDQTEQMNKNEQHKIEQTQVRERKQRTCECSQIQNVCLKTILKKNPCEGGLEEIASSVTTQSNGEALTCKPCKRKLKSHHCSCSEKHKTCSRNLGKDTNINLIVDVRKEKKCVPVHHHKKCKCKEKKRKETESKMCKCGMSPPIVICDKQPERNSFLEAIKSMISNPSKTDDEESKRSSKHNRSKNSSISGPPIKPSESHKVHSKLSNIDEQPLKSQHSVKSEKSNSHKVHRNGSKSKEDPPKEVLPKSKQAISSTKHESVQSKNRVPSTVKSEKGSKLSHKYSKRSRQSDLNAIYESKDNVSTDQSIFINPEEKEKTVQYMFLETFERFPFCVNCGLQNITYNFEFGYKSMIWLSLRNINSGIRLKELSKRRIETKWMPLCSSDSYTKMNPNDKLSQASSCDEQSEDGDKDFLRIVKKFEKYKSQMQVFDSINRKKSNSYPKRQFDHFVAREKRKTFLTKAQYDCFCWIFCNVIGPIIYFIYLVIFFWVTFVINYDNHY